MLMFKVDIFHTNIDVLLSDLNMSIFDKMLNNKKNVN